MGAGPASSPRAAILGHPFLPPNVVLPWLLVTSSFSALAFNSLSNEALKVAVGSPAGKPRGYIVAAPFGVLS